MCYLIDSIFFLMVYKFIVCFVIDGILNLMKYYKNNFFVLSMIIVLFFICYFVCFFYRFYVVGGRDGSFCFKLVECFDFYINKWTFCV